MREPETWDYINDNYLLARDLNRARWEKICGKKKFKWAKRSLFDEPNKNFRTFIFFPTLWQIVFQPWLHGEAAKNTRDEVTTATYREQDTRAKNTTNRARRHVSTFFLFVIFSNSVKSISDVIILETKSNNKNKSVIPRWAKRGDIWYRYRRYKLSLNKHRSSYRYTRRKSAIFISAIDHQLICFIACFTAISHIDYCFRSTQNTLDEYCMTFEKKREISVVHVCVCVCVCVRTYVRVCSDLSVHRAHAGIAHCVSDWRQAKLFRSMINLSRRGERSSCVCAPRSAPAICPCTGTPSGLKMALDNERRTPERFSRSLCVTA